eukprot:symbB.v1.2.026926.t1/scaffold2698.1/size85437/2
MHWSSNEWQADGWSDGRTSEGHAPRRRVWMGAALAAARKFIEVPTSSNGERSDDQTTLPPHGDHSTTGSWSSWDAWSTSREWNDWKDWNWNQDPGDGGFHQSNQRYVECAAPEEPLSRTLVASDPFIDLSLTSISQLALAERHADGFQNLEQALNRLTRQLRNPDVRLSQQQLLRCLELVSIGNEELVAAVTSRVSRAASSLSSAELVEAAESLAASSTPHALDALGLLLGESICRHDAFDLDQLFHLGSLPNSESSAPGQRLQALLRQAEAPGRRELTGET